ncbi:MAG: TatD family hydrolase [Parcubacteria group bacterium]|jgi:TatD DNase family protein
MLFDTHAHVNFAAYRDDAEEVLKRTLEGGVFVVNVGSQYSTSKRAVEMAEKYPEGIYAAVGLHPIHLVKRKINPDDSELNENDFETTGEVFDFEKYLELAKNPKVVAIGEMGLDYHHFMEGDNKDELKTKQKETFLQGIKLANETEKPIMVHCWGNSSEGDAYGDLLEILKNNPVEKKGIIHSFMGGYKTARKFTELGYKIGLNGIVTYAEDFNRLIREVDLKDIVLETDCPYLTPVPHKGERNEPLYVKLVAEKVAKIKEISVEEVGEITTGNARGAFGI